MAQTRRDIQATLAAAGISPLKRFGQNFLIDANLMRKLVEAAGLTDRDVVLEVGPGTGALTDHLVERAGHVLSVEIDRGLQAICQERFGGLPNFTLVAGDILGGKSRVSPEVLETLAAEQRRLGGRILLVSNLPYQIATPLLAELMLQDLPVSPMCFTVQAEVGERIASPPGSRTYGPVSILAQALGTIGRIARVPPQSFWPAPTIESVMLKWERDAERALPAARRGALTHIVHQCFQHRRKTMRSGLREILPAEALAVLGADPAVRLDARPEQLSPQEWVELAGRTEAWLRPAEPGA